MATLQLMKPYGFSSFCNRNRLCTQQITQPRRTNNCLRVVRAIGTIPEQDSAPSVGFAFVSSVLLPDGTPDVHRRVAVGGQKLRDIMLDSNIDLYGPYSRALLNCAGGGTCATCMVEVIQGKELLSPRTEKEKEKLKRKPKNWRLACQTMVGDSDSRGMVVIQQLPEWKAHEWKYSEDPPSSESP